MVASISQVIGRELDPDKIDEWLPLMGSAGEMIGATIRNTANPTMLDAGYKANVIPSHAQAIVDCRFLPGQEDHLLETIDELVGEGVEREFEVRDIAVETTFDGELVDAMTTALKAEDPGALPIPYMMSGGTDAKSFSQLGIRCFGFSPLQLPKGFHFASLFHGIDERVPVDALKFGVRVLDRFLMSA
jgi:acetylornithine deacetylase/succinyl-diaminopimelate desuccinylase-like protein